MLWRLFAVVAVTLVVGIGVLVAVSVHGYAHFYDGYDGSVPLNGSATAPETIDKSIKAFGIEVPAQYRRQRVEFDVRPGERLGALMTLPLKAEEPMPVIVFLHGSDQEKEFIEEICTPFNEAGFAMVCFDQYMRGERKVRADFFTIGKAYRERCWKTVHDTRRLIDYLQTRSDIAHDRIYLVGASYGAITGMAVVAQEKRIKAADLVVGGGNLGLIAKAPEVRRELPKWLVPFAGTLLKVAIGPAEPLRHAAASKGTPVLMQNGSNDGIVIPEAGKALFAALGEPKELRWYPINHPDREKNGAEVIKMLKDGLDWLVKQDAVFRK